MIAVLSIILIVIMLYFYNQYKFKEIQKIPPKGQFVEVDGLKLHYLSKGTGKPIVFLHGGILTGNAYRKDTY